MNPRSCRAAARRGPAQWPDNFIVRLSRCSPRAGRYAEAKYGELRRRRRRRVRPRLAIVLAPITAGTLVVSWTAGGTVGWIAAVVFGAAASLWCCADQLLPQHIENWGRGAAGERRTERVLCTLARAGWLVTHDVDYPGAGNVDYVAIGPGGVFVLDSKAWGGIVFVDASGVMITPRDNPEASWRERRVQQFLPRACVAVGRAVALYAGRSVPASTVGFGGRRRECAPDGFAVIQASDAPGGREQPDEF